jgi:hypothetical protein
MDPLPLTSDIEAARRAPRVRPCGRRALIISLQVLASAGFGFVQASGAEPLQGEVLPNGIALPAIWPPRDRDPASRAPMPVPYLAARPEVVPIDVGRQLFVDDFLIENTTLSRTFHQPEEYAANPIMKAETALEINDGTRSGAIPHSGGVWYDHQQQVFKMWYMTAWYGGAALALSVDGLHWTRPDLGVVAGTNRIEEPNPDLRWGMDHVVVDWRAANQNERYKGLSFYHETPKGGGGKAYLSKDGVHWGAAVASTGPSGDRNTFFYNPFRKKWVFSIKTQALDATKSRARRYWEGDNFIAAAKWKPEDPVFWVSADDLDQPDPVVGNPPEIYDLDVTAYESLLVGMFQIHKGPINSIAEKNRVPKTTELVIGYSRDGFHWDRPVRTPFVAASRQAGHWKRGYVHSVGGVLLVVRDRIFIYYGGFSGQAPKGPDMYAGGATGVAFLRRDGFASMDAPAAGGILTTRKLRFSGAHLFANVDASRGELKAEVLDAAGRPIPPFTLENSLAVKANSTRQLLQWRGATDLAKLAGKELRVRFHLRDGQLYSFWVSPEAAGFSAGYVAAGGPEFRGPVDSPTGFEPRR